jgi:hypothetical protein
MASTKSTQKRASGSLGSVALKSCLRNDARGSTDPVPDRIAMHLLCALGWHRPESTTIRNEGRHFGRCRRCKADLIEVGLGWKLAPRGYRVVWKKPVAEIQPAVEAAPTPVPVSASASPQIEAEAEASATAPLARRARADRRTAKAAELPPHLAKERRAKADRRKPLGKKPRPRPA